MPVSVSLCLDLFHFKQCVDVYKCNAISITNDLIIIKKNKHIGDLPLKCYVYITIPSRTYTNPKNKNKKLKLIISGSYM